MRPSPARCPGAVSLPWGVPSALLLHLFLCPHPAPTQWAGGQTLVPVTLCGPATSPATACVTLHGTETRTGTMGAAPSAVETSGMASPGDTVRGRALRGAAALSHRNNGRGCARGCKAQGLTLVQGSGSAAGGEILLLWEVEHGHSAVVPSLSDPILGTSNGSAHIFLAPSLHHSEVQEEGEGRRGARWGQATGIADLQGGQKAVVTTHLPCTHTHSHLSRSPRNAAGTAPGTAVGPQPPWLPPSPSATLPWLINPVNTQSHCVLPACPQPHAVQG